MGKKYNELTILKRLINIQKIHDLLKENNDVSKYSATDKIAYILWRLSSTRNSDIDLAIQFYKLYYSEYVKDDAIKLDDFYKIPKMYDIQRTRAEIQNTEGLFPATEEIQEMRRKRAKELKLYYQDKKRKTLKLFPDYYLYFDESGKNEKYFILAGLLINGEQNDYSFKLQYNKIKDDLSKKYNLKILELKFADISSKNLNFYKEFLENIFDENIQFTFISIIVENKGLKQKTNKNKTNELLKILLKELTSIIVRGTCGSPYADTKAKVNITLDKDGTGFDQVEIQRIKQELGNSLMGEYKYLIELENFSDTDSKNDIFVQLSDLYASSLNNIFSDIKAETATAKCKKEFAKLLLEKVGLQDMKKEYAGKKSKIKFLNKFIPVSNNANDKVKK